MGECELCGKRTDNLRRAKVEGTVMNLCEKCSGHGKIFTPPTSTKRFARQREEPEQILKENYHQLVKAAREKQKLTIQELARKISEKESVLHHVETKHLRPSMKLAQKLEKFFHIKLYDILDTDQEIVTETKGEPLTMGDILKQAMSKK